MTTIARAAAIAAAALTLTTIPTTAHAANDIVAKRRTVNSSGLSLTVYYDQEVIPGAPDMIRPVAYVYCGTNPGHWATASLYAQSDDAAWTWDEAAHTPHFETCAKIKVNPTAWSKLGYHNGTPRTTLRLYASQVTGTWVWAMEDGSGVADPGGRPTVADYTTDYTKRTS